MHPPRRTARIGLLVAFGCLTTAVMGQETPPAAPLAPGRAAALDQISADSLKGHLSFLASDLLEGRDTPSRGLDLAAEYIAAQFRRAGLEPVGDDGYFQTANWELAGPDPDAFRLEVQAGGKTIAVPPARVGPIPTKAVALAHLPLARVKFAGAADVPAEALAGRAVLVELPDPARVDRQERPALARSIAAFRQRMTEVKVALIVAVGRDPAQAAGVGGGRLVDPQSPEGSERGGLNLPSLGVPTVAVFDSRIADLLDAPPAAEAGAEVLSLHVGEPTRRPVKLRNVVGVLRGSDPELKSTYVMVTAHYDHVGVKGPAAPNGDRIYNGANDDGSGTVSVVELASILATLKDQDRPKRSLLFVTFFGEEHGLLGSRYYGRHPVVPIDATIADVNLEQVGRTDDVEGPRVAAASLTGFGYSEVATILADAGRLEGIKVDRHPRNSDLYFAASDNQALADLGVPAHTLCVAFQYPDYHGPLDHWDKLDYPNMARIDRVVARALLTLADNPNPPKWDESNPKAAKYLKAWRDRRGK